MTAAYKRGFRAYVNPAMRLKQAADEFVQDGVIPESSELTKLLSELEMATMEVVLATGTYPADVTDSFRIGPVSYDGTTGILHGAVSDCRRTCAEALDGAKFEQGCVMDWCICHDRIAYGNAL